MQYRKKKKTGLTTNRKENFLAQLSFVIKGCRPINSLHWINSSAKKKLNGLCWITPKYTGYQSLAIICNCLFNNNKASIPKQVGGG